MHVVEFCPQDCLREDNTRAKIYVLSHSQIALTALGFHILTLRLPINQKQLITFNNIALEAMKEIISCLEEQRAQFSFLELGPFCGLSKSRLKVSDN